jgi:hypothetical protein
LSGFGSVWFFRKKPVQTSLARFLVWLGFFRFGLIGLIGLVFFWFFFILGSVRFFQFQAYKTEPVGF